jgi:hypothetical protein
MSLQVAVDVPVPNSFLIHPKGCVLVLKLVTLCFDSRKSYHDVSSKVLDIQAPFWQPALQLLLTIHQINALKETA